MFLGLSNIRCLSDLNYGILWLGGVLLCDDLCTRILGCLHSLVSRRCFLSLKVLLGVVLASEVVLVVLGYWSTVLV